MRKLLVQDPKKNKLVKCGYFDNDTFYRDVTSEHFMRVVNGYGIQEIAFEELLKRDIVNIVIREKDTGAEFRSKTADWMLHGKVADYKHGLQRFLSLRFMDKTGRS